MPKKMRRLAIRSALAAKAQAGQLVLVDELAFQTPKTKEAATFLKTLGVQKSAVVLVGAAENDDNIRRSFSNLEKIKPLHWQYVNIRDLLAHEQLVVSLAALRRIEELWG
jgi:large subunit ribosomal protein L4